MMFMFPLLLQCAGVIPESLLSVINMLIYDESLSDSHPDLQMTLLGYLQQMDQDRYNVYVSTATICHSLQKTCKFLLLCQEEVICCYNLAHSIKIFVCVFYFSI